MLAFLSSEANPERRDEIRRAVQRLAEPRGANPVVFPSGASAEDLVVSGFVWPGNTARLLHGTAHAVVETKGEGRVILFAADPDFRLVWRATTRLFANAVLPGPSSGADAGAGY